VTFSRADQRRVLTKIEAPVQLPLASGWAQRAGDVLLGTAAILTARLFAGLFVAIALWPDARGFHPDALGRVLSLGLAAVCFALSHYGRGCVREGARLDARIVVTGDEVVIHHSGMLRERVLVPREAIRAIAIDEERNDRRFPVIAEAPGNRRPLTWLWRGAANSARPTPTSIPSLVRNSGAPNVLLIFEREIAFPGLHPRGGLLRHWPGPNGPTRAVCARVKDPDAARAAFESWGVVRPLGGDDLAAASLPRMGADGR
jgi:hypothetical protein